MRKLYIFMFIVLAIALIISVAVNAFPEFGESVKASFIGVAGQAGEVIVLWWGNVTVNPIYQQWHMLIWLVAGGVLTFTAMKAWAKRPTLLHKTSPPSIAGTMNLQKEPAEPEIAPIATKKESVNE